MISVTVAAVINAMKKAACTIAHCEQWFSVMNIIVTKLRNKLFTANISAATFITLDGLQLTTWNASFK